MSTPVLTIWFVNTGADVTTRDFLLEEPVPDGDYGRRLVAGLFPDKPVTSIGSFPLLRSTPPSKDEVYVGVFPSLTVIRTGALDTPHHFLRHVPDIIDPDAAHDVYVFLTQGESGLGGFAHWSQGTLRRAFSGDLQSIFEDSGLPDVAESPFWAGESNPWAGEESISPTALPFSPAEMTAALHSAWLGFAVDDASLGFEVTGFALDGRREFRKARHERADDATTTGTSVFTADDERPVESAGVVDHYYSAQRDVVVDRAEDVREAALFLARKATQGLGFAGRGLRRVSRAAGAAGREALHQVRQRRSRP